MEPPRLNNFQLVQGHIKSLVYLTLKCPLLHALLLLYLLINLIAIILLILPHVRACGNTLAMKLIAVVYRMLKWKWMMHRTLRRLLLVNVNETANERGIRNENAELKNGNAIEAESGIVILTKIQALVAMEHTSLDLVEGLAEVA
jgi:hypothetical protein